MTAAAAGAGPQRPWPLPGLRGGAGSRRRAGRLRRWLLSPAPRPRLHPSRGGGTRRAGWALRRPQDFRRTGRRRTFSFSFALGVQVRSSGSSPGASVAPPPLRTCVLPGACRAPGPRPEARARGRGAPRGPGLPRRRAPRHGTSPPTSHHPGEARPRAPESAGRRCVQRKRRMRRARAGPWRADASKEASPLWPRTWRTVPSRPEKKGSANDGEGHALGPPQPLQPVPFRSRCLSCGHLLR